MIELLNANALSIPLADGSVQMAATSPPYWMLRNYQVDGQLGSEKNPDCESWAQPKDIMVLRDDLSAEERQYVISELLRLGLA